MCADRPLLPNVTLVLGGVRSGKSRYAEELVEAYGDGLYLATAEAGDDEMAERIRLHRERRGETWQTVEEPLDIAAVLRREARPGRAILVDCLTLWISNVVMSERNPSAEITSLCEALSRLDGPVVIVSNEVGLGGIRADAVSRKFADMQGNVNQIIAESADRVVMVAAGLPLILKDERK